MISFFVIFFDSHSCTYIPKCVFGYLYDAPDYDDGKKFILAHESCNYTQFEWTKKLKLIYSNWVNVKLSREQIENVQEKFKILNRLIGIVG